MNLKIKIDYCVLVLLCVCIMAIEANYWALIPRFGIGNNMIYVVWIIMLFFILLVSKAKIRSIPFVLFWILYLMLVLLYNQELLHGRYFETIRIVLCILSMLIFTKNANWTKFAPKFILLIGIPNVIATVLFFLNNALYRSFIAATYKIYQSGTANGLYGYKAGIADHYSQNGTYISVVFVVICVTLFCLKMSRRKKIMLTVFAVIAAFAIFLTSKRAHILFSIAAVLFTYYLANKSKGSKKVLRTVIIVAIIAIFGAAILEFVPELSLTIDRFQNAGTDSASTYRFVMWEYALNDFLNNPLIGSGWYGFSYDEKIAYVPGAAAGAHNIYVQLLYETGIVGFVIGVT